MKPERSLSHACSAALLVLTSAPLAAQEARAAGRDVIYYDYVEFEGDQLRGGVVAVDPNDPLHAALGELQPEAALPSTTLMNNGPSSNRIDLTFVGDGYTAAELADYALDVDVILPTFFAKSPLDAYETFFNVHRVDVTSNESGVDNDPQGTFRDTALDMTYWCSGVQRLLCINVSKARSAAASAPGRDQILALANSGTYGGAGYSSSNLGTLAASNGSAIEIGLHEFGHSQGDLADEYDYGGPTTYTGGEPSAANVSIRDEASMTALQTKWYRWFGVPGAGTFEGASYSQLGIYRPTNNSLMRNLGRPFQGINVEQMIFSFYRTVRPIDDATPASQCDPSATYSVTPVRPVDHALAVQWSLDGVEVPGATGEALDASTLGLGPGVHSLSVEVVDDTPMVLDEVTRAALMTETRSWTLVVAQQVADNPLGTNPDSFSVSGSHGGRPVLGGTLDFAVDVSGTTGHASSVVLGFLSGTTSVLGGGQVLLMNIADPGGEVFGFRLASGNFAATLPIANDPSLCGLTVYAQALHAFGVVPFALSNRQTLTFGYP